VIETIGYALYQFFSENASIEMLCSTLCQ